MAKFSNNVLTAVAGFDGQILAQELVYNQKDFWNFAWNAVTNAGTWNETTTPIDLTGATIDAQIIRRQIVGLTDTRTGLDFTIMNYPYPAPITNVTATELSTDILTCADTSQMFYDQPVRFTGVIFGGVAINTSYYITEIITATTFKISDTVGGLATTLSTATGTMVINRVAPNPVTLPISNIVDAAGTFTMTIDDDTWDVIAGDPELDINATDPVCFTGRVKISFPVSGIQPAYDEQIFLLFLITSDGVTN